MKKSLFLLASVALATSVQASTLFINFGATSVEGWNQVTQTSGANLTTKVDGHDLKITCQGGNIIQGNFSAITSTWGTGNYNGASTSLGDMATSLGITEVGSNVWNTGIANGGWAGTDIVLSGFDATKQYNIWLIGGSKKGDLSSDNVYAWALDTDCVGAQTVVSYDLTGSTVGGYTTMEVADANLNVNQNVGVVMKMTDVVTHENGDIVFSLGGGQRASINALVIQEVPAAPATPEPTTASLSLLGLAALMMRRRA